MADSLDWQVIGAYVRDTHNFLTAHHLESYHEFVFEKVSYTIKTLNPLKTIKNADGKLRHEINVYVGGRDGEALLIGKPSIVEAGVQRSLLPNEARLKGMTYASDLFADILIEYKEYDASGKVVKATAEKTFARTKIASIPIMLHSRLCALYKQPAEVLKEMGECPYDQGGYFIIDGKEKVIVAQERMITNRVFVTKSSDPDCSFEGVVRCTSEENALFPKTMMFFVDSKRHTDPGHAGLTNRDTSFNKITVLCPGINSDTPIDLFVLFRALGIESDREILRTIVGDLDASANRPLLDFLRASVINGHGHVTLSNGKRDYDAGTLYSQRDAHTYLSSMVRYNNVDSVMSMLINDLLPNMGASFHDKALFLGHVVRRIVKTALGLLPETDRDNYMFKRVDLSGFLMAYLFRDLYNNYRNNVRNTVDQQYYFKLGNDPTKITFDSVTKYINDNNRRLIFNERFIQDAIIKSFKGNWGGQETLNSEDGGIVQDLSRLSYMGYVSHVRRLVTPLDSSSKIVGPHKLLTSHWGYVCPVESPDGANIGLTKHFAMLTHVTSNTDPNIVRVFIVDESASDTFIALADADALAAADAAHCKVFVNDVWFGLHSDPKSLKDALLKARRSGKLHYTTGVSWNVVENELYVRVDAGRCVRPLYIVKNAHIELEAADPNATWVELMKGGIEYVDVEESNVSLVAMTRTELATLHNMKRRFYTHAEIHPSTALSVYSNTIPMMHHNPATRATFSGAQGKQALGMYATNFNNRIDTTAYVLHYPQKSLASTKYARMCNMDAMPNGENAIVAVACYTGYNMEDSIIINRHSLERGMFNVSVFKSFVDTETTNRFSGEKVIFANPTQQNVAKTKGNFSKVDENGFPKLNAYIGEGDVYMGRCHVKTTKSPVEGDGPQLFKELQGVDTYTDASIKGSKIVGGTIDKVFSYAEDDGHRTVKVRFRKVRFPKLGDKAASRHGQKGVIGMIMDPEDMPFTADGLVPDLIINPHAIPTRMTIAHLVECIVSKLCCLSGTRIDCTAFEDPESMDALYDILENNYGMSRHGDEVMYNGRTGEQIATKVFIGPTYYMRLKHMVEDKINARAGGAVSAMTRQPIKGRSKGGGLRIGEMETNSLLAHGLGYFLKESMMERSDKASFVLDKATGTLAIANEQEKIYKNYRGEPSTDVAHLELPYAWKVVLQEIDAFSLTAQLLLDEDEEVYDASGVDDDESDADAPDDEDWNDAFDDE